MVSFYKSHVSSSARSFLSFFSEYAYVCLCGKKVVIILNKKSSLALCGPCGRKSQSGCLSTQKALPHHSWIQGQSEHVALAWDQQGSATGREIGDRLRGSKSLLTFSGKLVQIHVSASYILLESKPASTS